MSVIQKIRDKYAAVVIAVIALSLIGFILMDAFVGRGSGFGSGPSNVGKVNGDKITIADFEQKVNLQQSMYGQQAPPREQLVAGVWEQTVDEIIMQQEYDKLGLTLTAKELNDILFGANPPEWLKSQFTDPATGQYKVNDAKQYFANIKKQKDNPNVEMFNQAYIQPTINQALRMKYMAMISNSTYVPKWMADKYVADQNMVSSFSYVAVPYSSIADSSVKVSDNDIEAYIKAHAAEFRQDEANRSISYVMFNAGANATDSTTALEQVNSLKSGFATATDAEAYLNRVSSATPFYNGYVIGSKLQVPNADSIKNLSVGAVFGPYADGTNYTIAKLIDRRQLPDSVKVRHILIKVGSNGQPGVSDSVAKARIDSIATAIRGGADFNQMVLKYSDDEGSKNTGGEYDFTSQQFGNISKEFAETIFYGNTGDKKTVRVENQAYAGYHYIEVLSQKNIETAYKVAYLSKPIDASSETINSASSAASQFASNSRNKKAFDENANKQSLPILNAPNIRPNDFAVPGIGQNREFVKWIYDNEPGDVSEPYEVGDNYVVAVITSASEEGLMSVWQARPSVEPLVRNEKKAQQIIDTKFKSGTTLEDYAKAAGSPIAVADSVGFVQPFIPNIGNEPKLTGAAFNKNISGKVSKPIAGNTGVFVMRGDKISAIANTGISSSDLRSQIEMQFKQMNSYQGTQPLRKAADIKDNRSEIY